MNHTISFAIFEDIEPKQKNILQFMPVHFMYLPVQIQYQ